MFTLIFYRHIYFFLAIHAVLMLAFNVEASFIFGIESLILTLFGVSYWAKNIYKVEDTFEHVLWNIEEGEKTPTDGGKPFNAWKRIRAHVDDKEKLHTKCLDKLKDIMNFIYC